jgi:hypothetical protein
MVSTFEFSGNILGIMIKSDIDAAVFAEMKEIIKCKFNDCEKINLFIEIEKGHHISFTVLMKHFSFEMDHAKRFEKIGMVTNKKWFKNVLVIKDLIMDVEVRAFSHKERMLAIQWIAE